MSVGRSDSDAAVRSSLAKDGWANSGIIMGTYRGNRADLGDFVAGSGT